MIYYPPEEIKGACIYETENVDGGEGVNIYRRLKPNELTVYFSIEKCNGYKRVNIGYVQNENSAAIAIRSYWRIMQRLNNL